MQSPLIGIMRKFLKIFKNRYAHRIDKLRTNWDVKFLFVFVSVSIVSVVFSGCGFQFPFVVSQDTLISNHVPDLAKKPNLVWSHKQSSPISTIDYLTNNKILITTHRGEVYAFDLLLEKRVSKIWHPIKQFSAFNLDKNNGIIYMASEVKDMILAYSLVENRLLWKKNIDGIDNIIAISGNSIFITKNDRLIISLDARNGKILHSRKLNNHIINGCKFTDNQLIILQEGGVLNILSYSLEIMKTKKTNFTASPRLTTSGDYFLLTDSDKKLNVYLKSDWSSPLMILSLESPIYSAPVIYDSLLILPESNGIVKGIDIRSGEILWDYTGKGLINQPLIVNDDVVLIPYSRGELVSLDVWTGAELWKYSFDHTIRTCTVIPPGCLITDSDRKVHFLKFQ